MPARDGPDDHRDVGIVAIADAHRLLVHEVDAIEPFDERRDEMPPRLLAVDTMSISASSWSRNTSRTASRLPSASSSPSSSHGAHSDFGVASHAGFGRLPAIRRLQNRHCNSISMGVRHR
jgi:hypothetical protein